MIETYKRGDSVAQIAQCVGDAIGRNLVAHTLLGQIDASDQKRIFVAPAKCYVKDVWLITETGAALHGTAYHSFQVKNVTDAEDLMAAAVSYLTGGTAITADTPYKLTPDQNNLLQEGDVLELDVTKVSTPTALEECAGSVVYSCDEDDAA